MHQTVYIDIDEEITSIVDRLRKSKSKEVVIVVPKRAILIQSIVNLKLLKKEASELGKEIIIVTQDKFGKLIIEKAGIAVEQRLDDIAGQEIQEFEDEDDKKIKTNSNLNIAGDEAEQRGKKQAHNLGSDGYYQTESLSNLLGEEMHIRENDEVSKRENNNEERITNKELVTDVGDDLKRQQSSFKKSVARRGSFAPMDMIRNMEISDSIISENEGNRMVSMEMPIKKSNKSFQQDVLPDFKDELEPKKQKADNFFEQKKTAKINSNEYKNINIGNGIWKYFIIFGLIIALVIIGVASYLFLPKTSIVIFTKNKIQSVDTQIDGNVDATEIDLDKSIVPVKKISVTDEISKTYEVTGKKTVLNQKSHGTVTIYNEFSSSPQPLVATTRFEGPDNKIFRLVVGVTVPGTETVGTEIKPGAIEAEVVADQSGENYNIGASSFTIPGFKSSGNEKYAKIYAKSFSTMTGGGQGSQEALTVTDADIDVAKTKIGQEAKLQIIQKLKDSAEDGYIFLDDAINIDYSNYTLSNSSGDIADNFSITAKSSASAIVFKKMDVENILAFLIAKRGEDGKEVSKDFIQMEFGKSDANFEDNSIIIRVHATGKIVPIIDLGSLKNGILGKKESELKPYINAYPDIERIEISYWPTILSGKISAYESRVSITIDQSTPLR
jgi:hypothetical protein